MTDQEFIKGVWKKYDKYLDNKEKDKFFQRKQYSKFKLKRILKIIRNIIFALISTAGVVYAGTITYKLIQENTKTDFRKNKGYDYNQNMIYNNSMYYKKIYTYEEYVEAQKTWNNLVEMDEGEFENNFVIILAGENYHTTSLYVADVYNQEQKLCIELKKKDIWSEDDTVISLKISKDFDRKEVELINIPNALDMQNKYTDISIITENYSVDDAIKEGCFVIEKNKIVSKANNRLDEFVNNCNTNKEDSIRIYIKEHNRSNNT